MGSKPSLSLFLSEQSQPNTWLHANVFFQCGHSQCKTCGHAVKMHEFISISNKQIHTISSYININTRFFIYLLTCVACNLQNVECTSNMLHIHIRRHLSKILLKPTCQWFPGTFQRFIMAKLPFQI